jgi:ribonuclease HI
VWCDGSIHPYTKKASIGGIIKTLNGDVLYHYAKEVPYHRDILYIEYLALHTMLTKITKLNIKNINVHMDNLNLIDWIEGKPSKYGRLSRARKDVREIHESTLEKLNKLRYFIMTWIPREENKEADRLAKKIYIRG